MMPRRAVLRVGDVLICAIGLTSMLIVLCCARPGDGVVHEVYNGLLRRADWEQARLMPVGIIPLGRRPGVVVLQLGGRECFAASPLPFHSCLTANPLPRQRS